MKKQFVLATAIMAALASPTWAKTIADVNVPDSITAHQQVLQLNGGGVRSKFFMDLYVGSLFTTKHIHEAAPVLNGDMAGAIRLNITSGMITSEKLTEALHDGFSQATGGNTSAIDASIKKFVAATFTEEIKEGDQFTLVSIPNEGIYSYKNSKQLTQVNNEAFRKALMSIWLGKKPTDDDLKEDMLKG